MEKGRRSKTNININNQKNMSIDANEKKKETIKKVSIIISIIMSIIIIIFTVSDIIIFDQNKKTNLVINNNNITENLKNEIIIENDIIYLSKQDIANFFDKYISEENGKIVTSYNKKIAEINFNEDVININGSDKKIYAHAIKRNNDVVYLPISEMKDVYGIEIENISDTKVVVIDSIDKEQKKYTVKSNAPVKATTGLISKTVDRVSKGNYVIKVSDSKEGWTKIRTEKGKVGYIKSDKLTNEITIRENMNEEVQIQGKVNMFWEYFSRSNSAPDKNESKIDGVNVVSPAFFYINNDGKLQENVGEKGQAYIEWAHNNGYKVWPMVANSGDGMLTVTSNIMNSYEKRKALIESIVGVCIKYKLDGINIDFENMKQEDKKLFSRFIIELSPRIKEIGDVISVDVTAPDGGETWSMCYDRHVIGDVANYIVFMAYDEYGVASTKSGTTAGYDWVKLSLKKFLETEEIESNKIILGIPFYTRLWTENGDKQTSKVVSMKDVDSTIPNGVEKKWDEDLRQNYVEWTEGDLIKKMWIEDEKSLKEKLLLIPEYNLGGVAEWQKGMETKNIWSVIKEQIDK